MTQTVDSVDADTLAILDKALVAAARDVKVLSALAWSPRHQQEFLAAWERGQPQLPAVEYRQVDYLEQRSALEDIERKAQALGHAAGDFIATTARSYNDVVGMLEHLGTPAMSERSVAIYGKPGEILTGHSGKSSVDAARYFMAVADEFYRAHTLNEADICVPAWAVRDYLVEEMTPVLGDRVSVIIDDTLASKAAAGATRIRLRSATAYSEYDKAQLLHHEAFVHSLTALNGRDQPSLRSLSLGAPRTTATQEGLATFAELITGSIDMARLERIAMRVIAIDMALSGADFIDVFRYFVDDGQPPTESFNSTMRVFRGAPLTGGHAFTKDGVYLHGMLEVHTFFRWALTQQSIGLCETLFAGRMTLGDATRLSPLVADGTLQKPAMLPPWMKATTGLAGYLAFSVFANGISLDDLDSATAFQALDR